MDPLTLEEARLLGVMIEKSLTTPEAYPLTINALTAGCNQKSNREPVVDYDEGRVFRALSLLRKRGLADQAPPSPGARSNRYLHQCIDVFRWTRQKQAIMAELILRGPQTAGELRTRASRMAPMTDVTAVMDALGELMQSEPAHVVLIRRAPGQREDRYAHLLCGPVDAAMPTVISAEKDFRGRADDGEKAVASDRLDQMERRIEELEARLARLETRA